MTINCLENGCNTQPSFNYQNEKGGIYCSKHKKENMIDVKHKRCLECNIQPLYNFQNEKVGIYCKEHKKENMIDVKNKKCLEQNCNNRPNFNFQNEKVGLYCSKHKKENMIDVKHKRCLEKDCNTQPLYNLPSEKVGKYCKEHKKENMIDVKNKKCLEKNCNTRPIFNFQNEKIGKYCLEHKKENMVDVKSKRCLEENCNTRPSYNFQNEKVGLYCKEHKKENMIDVKHKKCLKKECNIRPSYNLPNEKFGVYCKEHAIENMIDVTNKKCLECDDIQSSNKYKGFCVRCFIHKFPDEKISRNYKTKENHMTDFIKQEFLYEVSKVFDKQTNGCSKRRPDVYVDKLTHVVIIECDENQHKDTSCENKRAMELFQDFANRPIVFIRFNPDSYKNEKGNKIPSSFRICKNTGISIIRDKKEWCDRLQTLKNCMNKWLITIPEKEVTNQYLFYDKNKFTN